MALYSKSLTADGQSQSLGRGSHSNMRNKSQSVTKSIYICKTLDDHILPHKKLKQKYSTHPDCIATIMPINTAISMATSTMLPW